LLPKFMKTIRHFKQNQIEILVLIIVLFQLVFPYNFVSAQNIAQAETLPQTAEIESLATDLAGKIELVKPARVYEVVKTYNVPVTAYSSTPDQTDSTPCITANGFDLCENNEENVIAANFLPFGTKVRIPELFGDQVFTVQDRMNARYYYRADVWFKERQSAKNFGFRYAEIEVVE